METLPETAWWGRTPRNCLSNGLVRSVQLALELNRDVTEPFSCSGRRNFTGIVVGFFLRIFFFRDVRHEGNCLGDSSGKAS